MNPVRSEKGVALIIVLLLLAVMAGLTTGLTLNGQTEIAMAAQRDLLRRRSRRGRGRHEPRGRADHRRTRPTDLLATEAVPGIGNGPVALNDQYPYSFQILDDDDPALYRRRRSSRQRSSRRDE